MGRHKKNSALIYILETHYLLCFKHMMTQRDSTPSLFMYNLIHQPVLSFQSIITYVIYLISLIHIEFVRVD